MTLFRTMTCMKTRVYWHVYSRDLERWPALRNHSTYLETVLSTHYLYGMHLVFRIFDYSYMITLEDDLLVSPDFYDYHRSLYRFAIYNETIFAVASQSHGPVHDCNYIAHKLSGSGVCNVTAVSTLLLEKYTPVWGIGLPRKVQAEYIEIFQDPQARRNTRKQSGGATLHRLVGSERFVIVPCSPRVKHIPNQGVHGQGTRHRWTHELTLQGWTPHMPAVQVEERKYSFLNMP